MTTLESSFDQTSSGAQKTSGLAVASLICSLICCLPITTIPGILLGIGAIVSIRGNPATKGMGLAVTGLVLGILFTLGQAIIYPKAYEIFQNSIELVGSGPENALSKGFSGDIAGFKASFHGAGATPTDVEAQAFLDAISSRYGALQGVELDERGQQAQQQFGSPSATFPYAFDFGASGTFDGEAEIVFSDAQRGGFIMKLGSITIFDSNLGDLTYPASSGQTPPTAQPPQPPAVAPEGTGGSAGGEADPGDDG